MSHYTTEVRYICEEAAKQSKSRGYNSVDKIIEAALPEVMPNFPIFDENYRKALCIKILKHYYTREIGLETVGLWKLKLDTKLNEIMPYYNQLYLTELIEYNPLYEVDCRKEYEKETDGNENGNDTTTSTGSSAQSSSGLSLYSDTPQGGLGNFSAEDAYLTNATKNSNTGNASNQNARQNNYSSSIDNTEQYVEHILGRKSSTPAKLVKQFRDNILNIDLQVINELGDLFMTIY